MDLRDALRLQEDERFLHHRSAKLSILREIEQSNSSIRRIFNNEQNKKILENLVKRQVILITSQREQMSRDDSILLALGKDGGWPMYRHYISEYMPGVIHAKTSEDKCKIVHAHLAAGKAYDDGDCT